MIDGREVDEDVLAGALDTVLDHREEASAAGAAASEASWFDALTIAAFRIFAEAGLDWVVVEVGLGGRLDSTNVGDAKLAVITNIELEHVEVLGNTRSKIAYAKAGIIKPGAEIVCGVRSDDAVADVFRAEASLHRCGIAFVCDAGGSIDLRNIALAGSALDRIAALDHGQSRVGAACLSAAVITEARLPGRLERLQVAGLAGDGAIEVVLDGAHVAQSISAVLGDLRAKRGLEPKPVVVLALGQDKNADAIVGALAGDVQALVVTRVARSASAEAGRPIVEAAERRSLRAHGIDEPRDAVRMAARIARDSGSWVMVTGSLYLIGEIGPWLRAQVVTRNTGEPR